MAALVSIGGFDFPEPSTYNATTSAIVDSARNVQGKVVCDVFKAYLFITKYFVGWEILEEDGRVLRKQSWCKHKQQRHKHKIIYSKKFDFIKPRWFDEALKIY